MRDQMNIQEEKEQVLVRIAQIGSEISEKKNQLTDVKYKRKCPVRKLIKGEIKGLQVERKELKKQLTQLKRRELEGDEPPSINIRLINTVGQRQIKEDRKLTKKGIPRKPWTPRNPRKKTTKIFSIGISLTDLQKAHIENAALELMIKPAEFIRQLIDKDMQQLVDKRE